MPHPISRYGSDTAAGIGIGGGMLEAFMQMALQQKKEIDAKKHLDRIFGLETKKTEAAIAEPGKERAWRTGEREGGQTFSTGEREGEQLWRTGEREGTESWKSAENILDRTSLEKRTGISATGGRGARDYMGEGVQEFISEYLMKKLGPKVSVEQIADILADAPMGTDAMEYLNNVLQGYSEQAGDAYGMEGLIQAIEMLQTLQVPTMQIPDQGEIDSMPADKLQQLWDSLTSGKFGQ
jgi:hypothetical protein